MLTLPLLLAAGTALAHPADQVKTFTLTNGMKVLLLEDHSIPNANTYIFWKVGSRNEVPGITGLSHFFEHMMFNGAKKYGPGEFDRVMEAAGGSNNAYTSKDVTVYTNFFPASSLELIFDLEADRIRSLTFDEKMINSERGVVHSEYTTNRENSNFEVLEWETSSVAMQAHPYTWPVIGYESDILSWTKEDLERYFATYYAPNNAVLVVVGDVTIYEVQSLCKKYLEPIPAHTPPPKVRTVEPPQEGERRLEVKKAVSSPHVLLAYHVPRTGEGDYYARALLETVLATGRSSRLYRTLVDEKQLATDVEAFSLEAFDPTLFYVYAAGASNVEASALEAELLRVLSDVMEKGITEKELQKAKNIRQMQLYHEMETLSSRANALGTWELFFGDYRKFYEAPTVFAAVTLEEVQKAAQTYFVKDNRTVGILVPEEEGK